MYKGPRGDGAWHLPEITCGLVVWGLEEGLTKGDQAGMANAGALSLRVL